MPETLLTPSSVKLFGRVMNSLVFTNDTYSFGGNYFLQRQLAAVGTISQLGSTVAGSPTVTVPSTSGLHVGNAVSGGLAGTTIIPAGAVIANVAQRVAHVAPSFDMSLNAAATSAATPVVVTTGPANFGRIYAFSFEGALYSMPKPALFLVHGPGIPIDPDNWKAGRSSVDESGVIAREWEFAGSDSLVYWEYEKGDFSLRLDTEAGPFEQILLAASLRSGADRADRSGAGAEVRSGAGAEVRSGAGAEVRSRR